MFAIQTEKNRLLSYQVNTRRPNTYLMNEADDSDGQLFLIDWLLVRGLCWDWMIWM